MSSGNDPRRIGYRGYAPRPASQAGYVPYCEPVDPHLIERIVIPSRRQRQTHAALLCANRVMHTGEDDHHGHFVAGFGWEGPTRGGAIEPAG